MDKLSRLRAQHDEAREQFFQLMAALELTLTDDQRKLFRECSDAHTTFLVRSQDVDFELLTQHFPQLAPAMRAVVGNCVYDENCQCFEGAKGDEAAA